MATTSQTFSQSALGSAGTPIISGNRVQIIQDGRTVGYRETVTITNPSLLNQGARLIEGTNNDRTPAATYTLDYGLDGRLQGGSLVHSGGLTNPAPVSYTINSDGRLTPTSPNIPVPAEMANIQLPDYSPFRFSDQTGALAEGVDTAYGGRAGSASSFIGNRIDGAAIGSSALAGDTRGVVSEGAGVIGSGVAIAAGAPLITAASTLGPIGTFTATAFLALTGDAGGKALAQSPIFNPTYDGYQWHDGSPQPWGYNGQTITRPAGWYEVVPNPLVYQGGRADPIKTEELNQRAELVATVRIQFGDQAAEQVSRMNNDQLRSFVAQNPTDASAATITGHLTQANIGAAPDNPSTLPASVAQAAQLNVMNGLSPSGYSVGTTLYVNPGPVTHASAGGSTTQPVQQVTTYRDDTTGAVMEVRVSGHLVNGSFVANANSASAFGMTAQGNVYVNPGFQVPTVEAAGQPTTASSTAGLNLQPVSAGQANVLVGLTPSGYEVGQVFYTGHGSVTRTSFGGETTTQAVVQITTYRDPVTGAAMEVRTSGNLVNGSFVANPNSTSAFGMDPRGNVVVNGENFAAPSSAGAASAPSPIIQVAPNATQSWTPSADGRTVSSTMVVRNGDGTTTTITTTADRSTGRNLNEIVHETRPGGVPQLVSAINFETGAQSLLNRDTGQMEFSRAPGDGGSGTTTTGASDAIPRAPSTAFVHNTSTSNTTGGQTVTLAPGGTVSDVVLLQNRAGNPITAEDVRAANPDLNINARYTNVRAGDTLVVPTRVGDNLVTTAANGDVRSVNTRTGEVTTVVNHPNGTSTQTTSMPDEFGHTEHVVVYDRSSGEVVSEQQAYVDSSTGVRTPVSALMPQTPAAGSIPAAVGQVDNYDLQGASAGLNAAAPESAPAPLSPHAQQFFDTFVDMLRQPQSINNSNGFDASQVLAGSGHGGVQTDGGLMAGGFSLTGGGSGVGGSTGSGLLPVASAPITLGARMANEAPLFQTPEGGVATEVTQLHIDIINASPTAQAMYQWAIDNNVPIVIRDGGGSSFNPDLTVNPNGTITLDASLFNSTTDQGSSAANAVHNAANVVLTGVHELGHAFNNATGQSPLLNPGTFTSPSDYAVARGQTEGLSYVIEGQVDSELVGQTFRPAGSSQAVAITPTTYAAGGDWGFDGHVQNSFLTPGGVMDRARLEYQAQLLNLGQNPSTASGGNYLNQGLVDYAAYWSGVPASQIRGVQVDDDGRSWSVTSQSGNSQVTTSFGTINTSLPAQGQQAISQSISTRDDDGNLLVTTTNHSTGASTATLIGPDQTVIKVVDIPALNPGQPSTTSTPTNTPVTPPAEFWNGAGVEPFQHQLAPAAAAPVGQTYAGTGIATGSLSSAGTVQLGTGGAPVEQDRPEYAADYRNGGDIASDQSAAARELRQQQQELNQANAGLNFFQSVVSLQNWSEMSDLQRLSAGMSLINNGVNLYNQVNQLSGNDALQSVFPSGFVAGIGFLAALESGNVGGMVVSGLSLANAAGLIDLGAGVIPGLSFIMALDSGDPVSIVSSGMVLVAALNPAYAVLGPIGIFIGIAGALFGSMRDIPTIEGEVQATWNDDGQLSGQVIHDAKGGGERAQGVFENLLDGFNQGLDGYNASAMEQMAELHMQGANGQTSDNQALQWALNPTMIPQVGYYYDPDGSQKEITLTFTNEQGQQVTQRYDLEGNRINAVGLPMGGPNLGQEFAQQTQTAMAPSWLIDGARMQYTPLTQEAAQLEAQLADLEREMQALAPYSSGGDSGQDYPSPNPERYAQAQEEFAALHQRAWQLRDDARQVLNNIPEHSELFQAPQVSQDGMQQSLQALTLTLGDVQASAANASSTTGRPVLANLDGDAYLEQVNWVQNNQALLGIDLNGDGRLQATELLTNNLDWLDANHDGRIDANDPAFAAIRLWVDVNGDANNLRYLLDANGQQVLGANGQPQLVDETTGLTQSGISAIELGTNGGSASIVRADGSSQALTEETLSGDTLGVQYSRIEGALGVLETTEQLDGSGQNMFYAQETGQYRGQAEHVHGGEIADERWLGQENIHAGDARMQNVGSRTIENSSVQTHTLLNAGDARIQNGALGTVLLGQDARAQTTYTVGAGDVVSNGSAGSVGGMPSGGQHGSLHGDTYAVRVDLQQQAPVSTTGLPEGVARQTVVVDGPVNNHQAGTDGNAPWVPPAAPVVLAPTVQAGQVAGVQVQVAVQPEQIDVGTAGRVLAGQDAQQGASGDAVVVAAQQVTSNGQVFRVASPSAAPIVVNAGDARVSSAPLSAQALAALAQMNSQSGAQNSAPARLNQPIAFVPVQTSAQTRLDVTADMIRSADSGLFGGMGPAALSAGLMGVALGAGAAQTPAPGGQQRLGNAAGLDADGSALRLSVSGSAGTSPYTSLGWDEFNRLMGNQQVSMGGGSAAVVEVGGGLMRPGLVFTQVDLGAITSAPVSPEVHGAAFGVVLPAGDTGRAAAGGSPTTSLPAATDTRSEGAVPVGAAGQVFMVPTWVEPLGPLGQSATPSAPSTLGTPSTPSTPSTPVIITPSVGVPGVPGTAAPTVSGGINSPAPAVVAPLTSFTVKDLSLLGQEDVGLMMDLRLLLQAGGSSPDVAGLVLTSVGNPSHGTVSLQMLPGAGGVPTLHAVFIPEANHFGAASFTYTVSNPDGVSLTATAHIDLASVNDAPVVLGESLSSLEDEGLVFTAATLLANDTDVDAGDALTISRVDGAQNGTVLLNSAGEVVFVPQPNYSGPAGFTYWVQDTAGVEVRSTVQLNIAPVNDAPLVVGETVNSNEDTVLSFAAGLLLANDSDLESSNSNLSLQSVGGAQHGSVQLQTLSNGTQTVLFTPQVNYFGVAGFSYTVSDGSGGSSTTTVVINLAEVNDAPVAVADASTGTEDAVLRIPVATLLANDTDADAGNVLLNNTAVPVTLTISQVGNALHGSVVLGVNPTTSAPEVRFTPDTNYFGPASFTYTVQDGRGGQSSALATLTITSLNDAPVATDETVASDEDAVLLINPAALLANEVDVDTPLANLTVSAVGNATHGVVVLQNNGVIRFTPEENYVGEATFDYTVSDGQGGLATATATITLANVNDAPVLVGETISGTEDTALLVAGTALLANDSDIDTPHAQLVITSVGNATHGTVLLQPNGSVRFTPALNYNASMGPATFEYTVSDGQGGQTVGVATVNIAAVNDAPVLTGETVDPVNEDSVVNFAPGQLLLNDSDVDNTAAQLQVSAVGNAVQGNVVLQADGSVVFTPTLNYSGAASFTYTVSDGAGGLAQATVDLNVVAVNDAPTLVNDAVGGTEDTSILIPVTQLLSNDSDVDSPSSNLVVTGVAPIAGSTHGTVVLEPGGQVRFTPDANFNGAASFAYTVSDGEGGLSTATAVVNVAAVNDGPTANSDALASQQEDTNLVITAAALLANDVDVDIATNGQVLQISGVSAIAGQTHGTVVLDASGNVLFAPDANYVGPVAFSYTVSDGAGGSSTSTASLTLSNVNDAPVLVDDLLVGKNLAVVDVAAADLLFNDSDPDTPYTGDTLTLVSVSGATHGSVNLLPNGDVRFVPEAGYVGMAQFNYTVADSQGATSTATAQVDLTNQAPTVVGETINSSEDAVTTIDSSLLLANDSDADNPQSDLHITGVGGGTNGSVSLGTGGLVTFTPNANFNGVAQFNYTVSDGDGGVSTGTATVNVASVNDAPVVVGESVNLDEDQVAHFTVASLLGNDFDIDSPNALSIVGFGGAVNGTVSVNSGAVTFTPNLNYYGPAQFSYTVSDGQGGLSLGVVNVNYQPVNDAPVANGEYFNGLQDTSYFFGWDALVANDFDAESSYLSPNSVWGVSNGTVSWNGAGVQFTPTANFVGTASFNYIVMDGSGELSNSATAYINLAHVNHNPVAADDGFITPEDIPATLNVLANDYDVDWMYGMGDVLSIAGVSSVTQGSATVSADGQSIVFTPNANYFGSAQLSYQVSDGKGGLTAATATINVLAQPDAPVASVTYDTSPDGWVWIPPVYDTSGDSPVLVTPGYQAPADDLTRTSGGLSVTDADPGDTFSISLALGPNYGGVTLDSATGGWVYQLAPWYQIGGYSIDVTDQFQLRVTDGAGLSTIVNVDVQARTEDAPPPTDNGGGGSDYPIVIDLDNDGLDLIRPQDSNVWVDVNGDGRPDRLGWAASSEAVLVLDERGDGRIDQRHEYSFVGYTPGATSDLEGLQAFDSNSDRLLSAADQHWAQFGLFQDNNANGRQDAGEFVRITDTTVTSISLVREGQRQDVNGNVVFGTSEVRFADGSSTRAGDVMFNTASTGAATAPVTPSFATPSTGGSAPLLPSTPAVTASGGAGAVPNAPAVQPATTSLGTVSNTEATRVTAPATAVVSGDTTRVVSPAPAAATTVATATTTAPTVTSAHVSTTMTAPAAVVVPASSLVSLVGAPPVAAVAPAAAPAALSPGLTPAPASAAAGITPSAQAVGVSAVPLAVSAAPVADPLRATPPTAIPTAAPTVNSSAMPVVAPDPGDQPDAAVTMRDITVPVDAPAVASIATTSSSAAAVSPAISAAGTTATAAAVEVKEVAPATESTTSAAAPASPTAPEQRAASDGLSGTAPLPSSDTPVLPDAGTAQAAAPVAPRESHTPQPTLPAPPEVDKEAEGAAHVDLRVDLTGNNANATNPVLAPSTASSGPASDAEIAQQALLLNSWSNAGPTSPPETALAFVPATSGGIEVVVNPDASVLPEAANSLIAPQVGTVVSVG